MLFRRGLSYSRLGLTSVTFFTKDTCMLCTNAKGVLTKALNNEDLQGKKIDTTVIDIMKPENSQWFDIYCYDVPVLHITKKGQKNPTKFMHYFDEQKIVNELSQADKEN